MQVNTFSYPTRHVRAHRDRTVVRGAVLLCVAVFVLSGVLALTGQARAELPDTRYDGLFLRPMADPDAAMTSAPRLTQTVSVDISGIVARGRVEQVFTNDKESWVEGSYRFPLPEGAAVDKLQIQIGDRVVEGAIKEREQAKKDYEAAREAGQTAALLDEDRPNMFSLALTNIAPNEAITVTLEYQSTVIRDGDDFEYRMPLVVAPRYLPEEPLASVNHPSMRAALAKRLENAARLNFPIDPTRGSNPTALEIDLDAGAELATLESPSHDLVVSRDGRKYRIGLRIGTEPADRDMVLRWRTERSEETGMTLFHENRDGTDYLLASIQPPEADAIKELSQPRDVTFVIDISGSMHGDSLDAAKRALVGALGGLKPSDRFDVIAFSDQYYRLFGESRPANETSVETAVRFVGSLESEGGTEMADPLKAALAEKGSEGWLRQIVFLTDGLVGNEADLFRMIEANLGHTRVFTVGLGSAPNGWFMRKAAEVGAGQSVMIANGKEAERRMAEFYHEIETPVAVDLRLADGAGRLPETYPTRIPDLYGARAVMVPMAMEKWDGTLTLKGTMDGKPFTVTAGPDDIHEANGIAKLWAEGKVESILDDMRRGVLSEDEARMAVLDVALPNSLATRFTSFVAIDKPVRRPSDAALEGGAVPSNLPDGMSLAAIRGPAGAAGWPGMLLIGFVLIGGSVGLIFLSRQSIGRARR